MVITLDWQLGTNKTKKTNKKLIINLKIKWKIEIMLLNQQLHNSIMEWAMHKIMNIKFLLKIKYKGINLSRCQNSGESYVII